ncbi:MAG: hypothetical protein KAU50_05745 [Candidatus Marinimicrobia bacterium]|nr:hypothetical protein [Candidatus Neomarinimicrobiota bacterium]
MFIKLTSAQSSFADVDPNHGEIGCATCHGGKEPAEFAAAHDTAYGFVRDPSRDAETACNPCHTSIVAGNLNSMHTKAWGERNVIAERQLGASADQTNFDECPAELTDGFDNECTSCHTTCGQCHVSRPNSVHGGFINSHLFSSIPDQTNNCMACHGSRIGVDFRGELEGNRPDAHYLKGQRCWDCHREDFHADASAYSSRYHLPDLPKCTDCHLGSTQSNPYHVMHWTTSASAAKLACYVCHSQPYNNCNSCHTEDHWKEGYVATGTDSFAGGEGYREYPGFRIGYNYDQNLFEGEYIVVRHIPIARDSYAPWGHATLATYDERPTWEYTSPHNIRLFTAQTDTSGGATCYENCHLTGDKATANAQLYLWQAFIDSAYSDESIANSEVVVDDHLPDTWIIP